MTTRWKILVTGATGKVGGQIVRVGADVRIVVRNPDAVAVPTGVEVVRGDLADPASMQAPLHDVDAVFLLWSFLTADAAADLLAVIERHAQRVVYLSTSGVDAENQASPIHQFHAELERAVQRTGLDWVFLRPASFASNNLAWAERIRDGVVRAAGADEARALIHEADIAAVAVRFEAITPQVARAQAVAAGYPPDPVEALFDHTGQFTPQPVTDAVYEITGRVPRSIRQWALDHAEAFR